MTRDDLFKVNAGIVESLIKAVAECCPKAFVLIISNPVNSTVPIAAEVLKKAGVFDPKRLFGVTSLDVVRAETFTQPYSGAKDPADAKIPVVGGHSGDTIVPLFSLAQPALRIPPDQYEALVRRVQFGGDEVVKAKDGAGSATLSMAYAGFRFAKSIIAAIKGEKDVVENTYVYLPGIDGGADIAKSVGVDFFSVPVKLGPQGAEKAINILGNITEKERALLDIAINGLKGNIAKGVEFAVAK
ncbi:hypothetical protein KEM54_001417 [Ascosphaera aggregata]|nr:hypothetical protein KEM54_001417 [Ascosphaera aggregata]